MNADLVVDASGRGSLSAAWLEGLGYRAPANEKVEIGIGYVTRKYRRRPSDLDGRLAIIVAGSEPNWRNGVIVAQENDTWSVSVGGYFGDEAPDDDRSFLAYLATLPTMEIHDLVAKAEPLTGYDRYRFVMSLRRRYEKLARFPENYLVFGDAICSFNPVYGQGMTVAAQEALTLQQCLSKRSNRLARRFFKAAAKIVDIPWDIAVGNDLRHPQVKDARQPMVRFINWYIRQASSRRDARQRAGDCLSPGCKPDDPSVVAAQPCDRLAGLARRPAASSIGSLACDRSSGLVSIGSGVMPWIVETAAPSLRGGVNGGGARPMSRLLVRLEKAKRHTCIFETGISRRRPRSRCRFGNSAGCSSRTERSR